MQQSNRERLLLALTQCFERVVILCAFHPVVGDMARVRTIEDQVAGLDNVLAFLKGVWNFRSAQLQACTAALQEQLHSEVRSIAIQLATGVAKLILQTPSATANRAFRLGALDSMAERGLDTPAGLVKDPAALA